MRTVFQYFSLFGQDLFDQIDLLTLVVQEFLMNLHCSHLMCIGMIHYLVQIESIAGMGLDKQVALLTDGRFSGGTRGAVASFSAMLLPGRRRARERK